MAVLGQLKVAGEIVCLADDTWEWLRGLVIVAAIYNGRAFDSTWNDLSWSTVTSSTKASGRVEDIGVPPAELIALDVPSVRRVMEMNSQETTITPSGKLRGFGQNLVTWLKILIVIPVNPGDKLVIIHPKVLEYGELGTRPLRTARAENIVYLGDKTKIISPWSFGMASGRRTERGD